MSRKEVSRKFEQIVEFAEISEFIDTPVKRYSSGMYVRLAFAVAAHLDPEILLVDEVLAVGDINFQKKCIGRMQEIGKEGRTILFVSHNISAVKQMCNKGLLLNDGRSIRVGPTNDIISEYVDHFNDHYSAEYLRTSNPDPASLVLWCLAIPMLRVMSLARLSLQKIFLSRSIISLAPHKGLSIGLQVILDDGLVVFFLYLNGICTRRLNIRTAGRYKSRVRIPKQMLNTVGIGSVQVYQPVFLYDVVENVTFEIVDNVGIVQYMGYDRKGSLLSTQLPWLVEQQ